MGSASWLSGSKKTTLKPIISVLPSSYTLLADKPAINGVELTKDTTSAELNLLTSGGAAYETVTLTNAANAGMSVLAVSDDGETAKISVGDILDAAKVVKTVETLDEDAEIGTYQKIIIKSED